MELESNEKNEARQLVLKISRTGFGGAPFSEKAGLLYSRNVASFYYCDKINLLETTTGFTILLLTVRFNLLFIS